MADALCGPSNALQNFQKHSTADRTLQQDRLISQSSASQGFRSAPGPNAGVLDSEFEAFQAGRLPIPLTQSLNQVPFRPVPTTQQSYPAGISAWAADFQQLSVSVPPPPLQQQRHLQQTQPGRWTNEFANQQNQATDLPYPQQSRHNDYIDWLPTRGPLNGGSLEGMQYRTSVPRMVEPSVGQSRQMERFQPTKEEGFDEEAFARAFDQAAKSELELKRQLSLPQVVEKENIMLKESAEQLIGSDPGLEQELIGADAIDDPRFGDMASQKDDPDALARTAGQLLESVKDNRSAKFQNSQFLLLMRQLRDKEVIVKWDRIVSVDAEGKVAEDETETAVP